MTFLSTNSLSFSSSIKGPAVPTNQVLLRPSRTSHLICLDVSPRRIPAWSAFWSSTMAAHSIWCWERTSIRCFGHGCSPVLSEGVGAIGRSKISVSSSSYSRDWAAGSGSIWLRGTDWLSMMTSIELRDSEFEFKLPSPAEFGVEDWDEAASGASEHFDSFDKISGSLCSRQGPFPGGLQGEQKMDEYRLRFGTERRRWGRPVFVEDFLPRLDLLLESGDSIRFTFFLTMMWQQEARWPGQKKASSFLASLTSFLDLELENIFWSRKTMLLKSDESRMEKKSLLMRNVDLPQMYPWNSLINGAVNLKSNSLYLEQSISWYEFLCEGTAGYDDNQ